MSMAINTKLDGVVRSFDVTSDAVKDDGAEASDVPKQPSPTTHSPRLANISSSKSSDRLQKRSTAVEDTERMSKRRKGDAEHKDYDAEPRLSDRARSADARVVDLDKATADDQSTRREQDRSKEKGSERHDRDYRERLERSDKSRGDDVDKTRDKSVDHHGRERSAERGPDRGVTRGYDRNKDDRTKDDRKSHSDDHFHSLGLPPPPPLPPNIVPQSLGGGRRDEDVDRRAGATRHSQRLSPRIDERERRRSEENSSASVDDTKRRRDDDFRDRKRDDREAIALKVHNFCFLL